MKKINSIQLAKINPYEIETKKNSLFSIFKIPVLLGLNLFVLLLIYLTIYNA